MGGGFGGNCGGVWGRGFSGGSVVWRVGDQPCWEGWEVFVQRVVMFWYLFLASWRPGVLAGWLVGRGSVFLGFFRNGLGQRWRPFWGGRAGGRCWGFSFPWRKRGGSVVLRSGGVRGWVSTVCWWTGERKPWVSALAVPLVRAEEGWVRGLPRSGERRGCLRWFVGICDGSDPFRVRSGGCP